MSQFLNYIGYSTREVHNEIDLCKRVTATEDPL